MRMLVRADARHIPLADRSVHCVVTSPPYFGLRDYGHVHQIGLEPTPAEYVAQIVAVFRELRRVLRDDGTSWLNLGDSYSASPKGNPGARGNINGGKRDDPSKDSGSAALDKSKIPGLKPKDLIGVPWRVALALQEDGWWLRSEIIWRKRSPMPSSVEDRPTTGHEHIFLLTKSPRYFYDISAERQPWADKRNGDPGNYNSLYRVGSGRNDSNPTCKPGPHITGANLRTVWDFSTEPYAGAHFATYPTALAARCIKLGTSEKGCCPECLAPWMRVVMKDRKPTRPGTGSKITVDHESQEVGNRDPERHTTATSTTGWVPTCRCGHEETVPAIVLDPFVGSGTTVLAAKRLGRSGIGLDASHEYLSRHAAVRIKDAPAEYRAEEPIPGQLPLFS